MTPRKLLSCTLLALVAGVILQITLSARAQAALVHAPAEGPGSRDLVAAAMLEGWSGLDGVYAGPGLVSRRGQLSGTLVVRGDVDFIYGGDLMVTNLGSADVDFALSDGTPLMSVPAGTSSVVRPFLALPPNEVVYSSSGGSFTEFVWVAR